MSEAEMRRRDVTRITCVIHRHLTEQVTETLRALGARTVLIEAARCVRHRVRRRRWGLPGMRTESVHAPMEILRTTVAPDAAEGIVTLMAASAELTVPGRGAIYAQDVVEFSRLPTPAIAVGATYAPTLLRDLTLLTCILSAPGSGEELARLALQLGAGVPLVSRGIGTGIRDRIGLLRITVPPEKDVVHLVVPSHDAVGLLRLLIEEGRLDRPGGGFLYQTPIRAGMVDSLARFGRQEHAASMEQVIAALDDLTHGTTWRRRFVGANPAAFEGSKLSRHHREIVFVCAEGLAEDMADAAIRAGAGGATISRVRCLGFSDLEGGLAARERGVVCVPSFLEAPVLNALRGCAEADGACRLQVLDAHTVFAHSRARGSHSTASCATRQDNRLATGG